MSSKTNFKRLALVAVASLGLGVLSAVPSKQQLIQSQFLALLQELQLLQLLTA